MTGIYIASKTKHAAAWRRWRDEREVKIISSWIDYAELPDVQKDFRRMWTNFEKEICTATALVFYAEAGDVPKGAYVEVGMALACGVPVFVYLKDINLEKHSWKPIGSWLAHPQVHLMDSISEAFGQAGVMP